MQTLDEWYRRLVNGSSNDAISVILKLVGETCNINCYYCYEKRKPYEQALKITSQQVEKLIESVGGKPISLELHGGEPLLIGKEFMKAILKTIRGYPQVVRLSIQTNGILLDEAWLDLFDEHYPELDIGISLDGSPETNAFRVDYSDRPTNEAVEASLNLLSSRGRDVGIISVVSSLYSDKSQAILDYFTKFSAIKNVSFVPCFDFGVRPKYIPPGNENRMSPLVNSSDGSQGHLGWSTTPDEYASFLIEAFDYWCTKSLFQRFLLEPVMTIIKRLMGLNVTSCHFNNLKCDYVFTLYPDGTLGSCDELPFASSLLKRLDSVNSIFDITQAQAESPLLLQIQQLMEKCQSCLYNSTCGGGCLATRFKYHNTQWYDAYCDYRIRLIEHIRDSLVKTSSELLLL